MAAFLNSHGQSFLLPAHLPQRILSYLSVHLKYFLFHTQDRGFVLYRTYLTYTVSEPTQFWVPNNGVHDRAYVMVDGVRT